MVLGKSVEASEPATFLLLKGPSLALKSKELCVSGSIPEATTSAGLKDLLNRVQGEKERHFPCVRKKNQIQQTTLFSCPLNNTVGFFFHFLNIFIYYLQSPMVQLPLSRWKLEGKRKKKAACADISIWHLSEKSLGTWGLLRGHSLHTFFEGCKGS